MALSTVTALDSILIQCWPATAAAYTPINQNRARENRARENASRGIKSKRTIAPQQLKDFTVRLYRQSADPSLRSIPLVQL